MGCWEVRDKTSGLLSFFPSSPVTFSGMGWDGGRICSFVRFTGCLPVPVVTARGRTSVCKTITVPELRSLQPDDWDKGAQFRYVELENKG